jgi:hypothetical protein
MSALHLNADICTATRHVRFVPIADFGLSDSEDTCKFIWVTFLEAVLPDFGGLYLC